MLHIQSFTFNPFSENTYVIYTENGHALLVDPGNSNNAETERLSQFISSKKLTVDKILLTHAHIDHIFGLQWAYDFFKVPVYLHQHDKMILDNASASAARFGFDFPGFNGDVHFLQEGDTVELDRNILDIYHVPGHSPGSIAFHCAAQKFIVSGDVLFEGSIGRTDLPGGNHAQLLQSIREKLFVLEPETKVYSGHGNPTEIGFEQQYNPFLS